MNKQILIGVGVVVLFVGAVFFMQKNQVNTLPTSPSASSTEAMKIGAVLSLTGAGAHDGNDMKMGIDLAAKELAAKGTKVDIEYQDDATDPKKTISALHLLKADNISTVIGLTWGYIASAAIPTIQSEGMTVFSPANSSDIVGGASSTKRVYYGAVNIYKQVEPVAAWLSQVKATKIAAFSTQDAWGDVHIDAWSQAAAHANAVVVQTEEVSYANEAEVMPTLVQKAKVNSADAILWTGTEAGAIALLKELERQDMHIAVLGTKFVRVAIHDGKAPGGANVYSIETDVSHDFEKNFQNAYGVLPSEYAEAAYHMTYDIAEKRDLLTRYDAKGDVRDGEWTIKSAE